MRGMGRDIELAHVSSNASGGPPGYLLSAKKSRGARRRAALSEGSGGAASFNGIILPDGPVAQFAARMIHHPVFVTAVLISLGFSLMAQDIWSLFEIPDKPGNFWLDFLLVVVLIVFAVEFTSNILVYQDNYVPYSMFFWVDLLGMVSVIMEFSRFISLDAERFMYRYGVPLDMEEEEMPSYAARATVSFFHPMVQAIRLLKILKVLSYFRVEGRRLTSLPMQAGDGPGAVSRHMMDAMAMKVPLLTVFFVAITPFISFDIYSARRSSMNVWGWRLEADYWREYSYLVDHPTVMQTTGFNRTIEDLQRNYLHTAYFPYRVVGFPPQRVTPDGRRVEIAWDLPDVPNPERAAFIYFERIMDCSALRDPKECRRAGILFNFKAFAKLQAWEHLVQIALVFFVIIYVSCEVGRTLMVFLDMEKLANISKLFMKQNLVEDSELDSMCYETKGVILGLMDPKSGGAGPPRPSGQVGYQTSCRLNLPPDLHDLGVDKELVESWDLDLLDCEEDQQGQVLLYLFFDSSIGRATGRQWVDPEVFLRFIAEVREGYFQNPYHNYTHAVDVCHTLYRILCETQCKKWLSDVEQYALLVSAIGHDIGHLGRTNAFLLEVRHELALRYNDQSPLENMHCARLFEICANPRTNIFQTFSCEDFKLARKVGIAAILHTDMAHHFEMVKRVNLVYEVAATVCDLQATDKQHIRPDYEAEILRKDTLFLLKLFLHLADISNPLKPFLICKAWAMLVLDEMFSQGEEEKRLGIPIGMLNDREKVSRSGSQHGFINFVVAPLTLGSVRLFNGLSPLASQMAKNLDEWRNIWVAETGGENREEVAKRENDVQKLREEVERLISRTALQRQASKQPAVSGMGMYNGPSRHA